MTELPNETAAAQAASAPDLANQKSSGMGFVELTPRILPRSHERLIDGGSEKLWLNAAAFADLRSRHVFRTVRDIFAQCEARARKSDRVFWSSTSYKTVSEDAISLLQDPVFSLDTIDTSLRVISEYQRRAVALQKTLGEIPELSVKHLPHTDRYPNFGAERHPAVVRYGVVELRVVENYLLDKDAQKIALETLLPFLEDESRMYAASEASGYLLADDVQWNLRRLMTNAGFYVQENAKTAWQTLENWTGRYLSALNNSSLVWHNSCSLHYLKILFKNRGNLTTPNYVSAPSRFQFYDALKGRDVLFVSPLAHLVQQQVQSARIWNLYQEYAVPRFSLRSIPAWVSTWPNRPHTDWSETFARLCETVEAAYRERPFEIFVASCGCYGLPLCDFVRSHYGCEVIYLGNFPHSVFGIRQRATSNLMSGKINAAAWLDSDLGKYMNMEKIDRGRYVW